MLGIRTHGEVFISAYHCNEKDTYPFKMIYNCIESVLSFPVELQQKGGDVGENEGIFTNRE